MKITVSLDTQAVITQPSPLRFKGGCFNPVEIGFTRNSQSVPLPDGAVIEFALKPKNQWTGGLLAYLNTFTPAAGNLYSGSLNCASSALLAALGLSDQVPANDLAQVDASAEVTWSFGGQKFRSVTFSVTIESPLTDDLPVATPDPELYPLPSEVARKSDIAALGSASRLNAGIPNGVATLDGSGKLTGAQVPDAVALKADLKPTGSNRIVIGNRFALASLPAADVNSHPITTVNVGDVVHQAGTQGSSRTAAVNFSEHLVTDDDINNGSGVRFFDEYGSSAGIPISNFGGTGTVVAPTDFANALANAINSYGLNAYASVTGEGQVTITSHTSGPLPGGWIFQQDTAVATYSETEGTASLPPGDYIVADLNNLGNATGYQGIGDTVDFLNGYGAPTAGIGEEGNGYVDQNNGDFYHRDANGWNFVLNIKGPQGDQGPQGNTGLQGLPGNTGLVGPSGSAGKSGYGVNDYTKIGMLLYWQNATPALTNFTLPNAPNQICYDGANVWINYSTYLIKVNTFNGSYTSYSVGVSPTALCFDGTDLWITNSTNLLRITRSTGAIANTYAIGKSSNGICFDGSNLWVTTGDNYLMKITPSTGAVAASYNIGYYVSYPMFDGTSVWVTSYVGNRIFKVRPSDGSILLSIDGTSKQPIWGSPTQLCFDGTYLWFGDTMDHRIVKMDTSGNVIATASTGGYTTGICFDGTNIWVANFDAGYYEKFTQGLVSLGTFTGYATPKKVVYDGVSVWGIYGTASNNSGMVKFPL
ncbi:MAG: hypothetical protein ACFUZC_07655 [Chthoniobacteraceae bacterium]